MVVDALLLCFCEDCKMNDGSAERPYFMNDSLMVSVYISNHSNRHALITNKFQPFFEAHMTNFSFKIC